MNVGPAIERKVAISGPPSTPDAETSLKPQAGSLAGSLWLRLRKILPADGVSMLHGAALLFRGTAVAQVLGIAILPVLTRLYSAEAFGQFQLYLSILNIALVCSSMRYEFAILTARNLREVGSLVQLCSVIVLVVAALFGLGLTGVKAWPALVDTSGWRFGGWVLAGGIVAGGTYQVLGQVVTRFAAYREGGNARVIMAGANGASSLAIGLVQPLPIGIVIGDLTGKVVASAQLILVAKRQGVRIWPLSSILRLAAMARRYRNYALVSVPSGLISALSASVAPIMILTTFGTEVTGQFGLVERTFTLAVNVLIATLAQVYTSRLAEQVRKREYAEASMLFRRTIGLVAIALLVPCAVLTLASPILFKVIFGGQWALAGQFCRIMAPYYFISIVQGVFTYALFTLHRQRVQLVWELVRLPVLGLVWFLVRIEDMKPLTALTIHYAVLSAFCVLLLGLVRRALRQNEAQLAQEPSGGNTIAAVRQRK